MKFLFVYNADSGLFNSVADAIHKVISPDTYECNLCAITYGPFTMRNEWRDYVEALGSEIEFIHRDEFQKRYDQNDKLPAVYQVEASGLKLVISAEQINKARSIKDLIGLVDSVV